MAWMLDRITKVVENRSLGGGHFLLSLDAPRQAQRTRPGQFAMIQLLGRSDILLRRPMSIYDVVPRSAVAAPTPLGKIPARRSRSVSTPEIIQLLYKIVGRGTRLMGELKPGEEVGLIAPLGHGFFEEDYLNFARESDEALLIAGGIGIAALLMPAKELAARGIRTRLFFGGRTKHDLAGLVPFRSCVRQMTFATEDGSRGHHGYVTKPLADYLSKQRHRKFLLMVCGPWPMLEAAVALASEFGHRTLVSMENRMGCGLGVCLGCSIRVNGTGHGAYERVCTEGPVFWSDRVTWGNRQSPDV